MIKWEVGNDAEYDVNNSRTNRKLVRSEEKKMRGKYNRTKVLVGGRMGEKKRGKRVRREGGGFGFFFFVCVIGVVWWRFLAGNNFFLKKNSRWTAIDANTSAVNLSGQDWNLVPQCSPAADQSPCRSRNIDKFGYMAQPHLSVAPNLIWSTGDNIGINSVESLFQFQLNNKKSFCILRL